MMLLDDLACNGKPDPQPTIKLAAAFLEMEKSVEDTRADIGGNANAMILNGNTHAISLR
jgi:hypothetical protein